MDRNHVLIHLSLIAFLVIYLFPIVFVVCTAFQPKNFIITQNIQSVTLENFEALFSSPDFINAFMNGLIISGTSVAIALGLGITASYAVSRWDIKFSGSMFFTLLTTRMAPVTAFAIPYFVMMSGLGLIGSKLGMIIVYIVYVQAFAMWLMRGFFERAPVRMEQAAMIDGYSRWEAFRIFVFPRILSGVLVTALFCFLFVWNEFLLNSILSSPSTRTVPSFLASYVTGFTVSYEKMAAGVLFSMLPVIIIAGLLGRKLVKGFALGMVR